MTTDVQKIKQDEQVIVPPVDIYESENEYVIKADMPGVRKENISITFDNNELNIDGSVDSDENSKRNLKFREFTLHNFSRSFKVGNDIDPNRISANMNNGVLTLAMAKKEELKPKKIEITAAN